MSAPWPQNNNFWSVKWSETKIKLYWLPNSGQSISEACSGSDNDASKACEFYWYNECAIRLGKFESGNASWTTGNNI